ncbi:MULTISPECIES: Coenzyme F420 hydrogenase/dehydrogenase, beta subunit C-terminal domain [unclassified Ruegeria]|uniref:Coenzyme F420 hydrogenase/dehydrogenase, beta subunit C-terminal domain n=1 Tax=unclassified Ruegeria TaxID=2625375 RepID=UPI001488E130|nr:MULTISPECIES: Coenzyme F420 hydrogenase/dehydrogenase, beta subunit C-terminal domain [unclassified Ruegeria]NOD62902.1 hydrogenase [Ruegeria sp. HKCCD6109]
MTNTDPNTRFDKILKDGLCIGCGLCQSVLGSEKLQMEKARDGELRPKIQGELSNADVDLVYDICPGTRCEAIPPEDAKAAPHHDLVWGPYHSLSLAWASEANTRYEGSTAGVLTALAQYLLHSGRVSFILHVKASEDEPTFGMATISTTVEEVLGGAGSRYGPTAPLIGLGAALDREEPFAVVAKPCDLNAIRNLAHEDARVNRLIKYMMAMVCGGFMPDQAMGRFLADNGIEREQVTGLRYRGRGCPGPTTIKTADGDTRDFHYLDFWGEDESCWSLPFRCKVCPDGIGEAADIAAADTWPVATPDREVSKTDPGTNSIITRSVRGEALLQAAIADGFLTAGGEVDIDYMNKTQPHQVTKKRSMYARFKGMKRAGQLVPATYGLRLEELSDQNSAAENSKQEQGAFERARRLSGTE